MKRFHVHVAVKNLSESINFYSAMFGMPPTVMKSDYAKWLVDDPRVNFAISQRGTQFGLNHLGIQAETPEELLEMQHRLQELQAEMTEEADAECCYAKSDKYWVTDQQGIVWETFHTLSSIPVFGKSDNNGKDHTTCCIPLAKSAIKDGPACCVPLQSNQQVKGACC